MRFLPPSRDAVPADVFAHPLFADLHGQRDLLCSRDWPEVAMLDARLQPLRHSVTGSSLSLRAQEDIIDDGLHYEERIFRDGVIATRACNWHDLLNALIWKIFPATKSALNACQAQTLQRTGSRQRTRAQDAWTQFDEAGAMVVLRDPALLPLWDAHDWTALFLRERSAWSDGRISLSVFGHAVMEHALHPQMLLVTKTLVFVADRDDAEDIDRCTADAIIGGDVLRDPQALRPLPVSGIPGWHHARQDAAFYRDQPCFRPLRAGRSYPLPRPLRDPATAPAMSG